MFCSKGLNGVQFNRHLEFKAWFKAQVKAGVEDAFRGFVFWLWVKEGVKALVKAVLKCLLNCTPEPPHHGDDGHLGLVQGEPHPDAVARTVPESEEGIPRSI